MDIEVVIDEILKETKAKGFSFPKQVGEGMYDLGNGILTGRKGFEQFVDNMKNIVQRDGSSDGGTAADCKSVT